jgi:hypothetical protein
MKIDNFYKFIASTFGLAYFIGLITGVFYSINGTINQNLINTKLFLLPNSINFRNIFVDNINIGIEKIIIPFSYLIDSVKYGVTHSYLLTSSFLGQIKLLVQLIPDIFYFLFFIIFATIGIKILLFIIQKLVNILLENTKKKMFLKIDLFNKTDVLLIYISLLSLFIASIIEVYLSKIFFIFLINFQLISYIFIIVLYLLLIILCLYIIYKTILSLLENLKKIHKKIIYK